MKTRSDLYVEGVNLCLRFLALNNVQPPEYRTYEEEHGKFFLRATAVDRKHGRSIGLYWRGRVWVNIPRTSLPVVKPGAQRWSWPGYKIDRTATGVVAHETGHYVIDVVREQAPVTTWAAWLRQNPTRHVSGYHATAEEALTETLRLYILNPDLLKTAIPWRWQYCRETMGLKPLRRGPWQQVLNSQPHVTQAKKWILGGRLEERCA